MTIFKRFLKTWLVVLALSLIIGMVINMDWTEILIKNGNTYPDPNHPKHRKAYNDGQIVGINPVGYYKGKITHKHFTILLVPGKYDPASDIEVQKLLYAADKNGKLPWDPFYDWKDGPVRERDWLVDLTDLLQRGVLLPSQLNALYNKDISMGAIPINLGLFDVAKHENHYTRKNLSRLFSPGSISQGTPEIGSGADYDDLPTLKADIITQTGDLTALHRNEETNCGSITPFNHDRNGHNFKVTAKDEESAHNGRAYGNGARVKFTTSPARISVDIEMELSKLAFDCAGGNRWVRVLSGSGNTLLNRLLLKGDSSTRTGIEIQDQIGSGKTAMVRNSTVYGMTDGTYGRGFLLDQGSSGAGTIALYNCNSIKNKYNFNITTQGSPAMTLIIKNCFGQGCLTACYINPGQIQTHAKNISEDASSPDAAYRSMDKHSVFSDYANNDFRLGSDDSDVNDGEDLNAIFTDAIAGGPGTRPVADIWDIGSDQYQRAVAAKGSSAHTHSFV